MKCKIYDPRAGVPVVGRGYISHYSEYVLSSTISIYSPFIAIVLGIAMLFSCTIVDAYLFFDGAVII